MTTPGGLMAAKAKVRALNKAYDGGRSVWMDAKKTREEMQPARMVHRGHEYLSDVVSGRTDGRYKFSKNPGAKTISVQIEDNPMIFVVARIFGGNWRWQEWAKKNLTNEELETASDYAREA
jgi:hypothetical protein